MTSVTTTRMGISAMLLALTLTACSDRAQRDEADAARDAVGAVKDAGRDLGDAAEDAAKAAGDAVLEGGRAADAAFETVDVKGALIADSRISANGINVDTDHITKVVTLRGQIPSEEQKAIAGEIATSRAVGYRVVNELIVR